MHPGDVDQQVRPVLAPVAGSVRLVGVEERRVTGLGFVTVNVTVMCTAPLPPFGTVTGVVTGRPGLRLPVLVTPAGGSPLATVRTDASGAYSAPGVPVGGNGGSGSVVTSVDFGPVSCAGGGASTTDSPAGGR